VDTSSVEVQIPNDGKVKLTLMVRGEKLQFFYALESEELKKIGPVYDASVLSDECVTVRSGRAFTGAFVGMACSDLNGLAREATFDYFVYRSCSASDGSLRSMIARPAE
jgi:xylan 1,4-beta-xylosidase